MPLQPQGTTENIRKSAPSGLTRFLRFAAVQIVTQAITVVAAIYISILIANMGGQVDEIRKGMIRDNIAMFIGFDEQVQQMDSEEKRIYIDKLVAIQEKAAGLDQPFAIRSVRYLTDALTLNLGQAENMHSDSGSKLVRNIILERLPATLILFATSQLLMFFITLFTALYLSRHYGSFLDKLVLAFAPTSAAPSWFYALFLILVFAGSFGILPFGGMVSAPPPDNIINYALSVMKHMILPVSAIAIGGLFAGIYGSRTFFLIYSKEDYVEMAHAKGLHPRTIERRYILRPTLPIIVTGFALGVITIWTGSITLETIFNWPGLGRLLFQAANLFDTPVIIGSVVIYAYLLAMTVFLLDITYALLDPRLKVGEGGAQ
ncbi:ABC transporter permease [Chloroflexi bacterium TSY]|nr:ABC transporter permease [Chloroflexi bacterium TSY]